MGDKDDFEGLLARIRDAEHPHYGSLCWNGKSRSLTETVLFKEDGNHEPDRVIRDRAVRYLAGLTPKEREAADIVVVLREGSPVRAEIRAETSELSPARLRELRERAGL